MNFLDKRHNGALEANGNTVNGATADIAITVRGSDWYWAVCAIMTVATLAFLGMAYTKPRSERIFHYITAGITMVAAIAYFTMASNLGFTPIMVEYHRSNPRVHGDYREIFYVRYIDWMITTPLLLMDLLLTSGTPWPTLLWVILVDWVMIITGLVGALVVSRYKWGYFAFGCAALAYIVYQLAFESRKRANILGKDIGRVYLMCGALTTFLWILYPIAWGICEGGNVISPDAEAVFYGILDVLAKPVFGTLLLIGHRNIAPSRLGLHMSEYDGDASVNGGHHKNEKLHNGVSNGNSVTDTTNGNGITGTTNGVDATNGHSNGLHTPAHGHTTASTAV